MNNTVRDEGELIFFVVEYVVIVVTLMFDVNWKSSVCGDLSTPCDSCVGFFLMYLGNLASILLKEHAGEGIIVSLCTKGKSLNLCQEMFVLFIKKEIALMEVDANMNMSNLPG